jgi:hypothetical protein
MHHFSICLIAEGAASGGHHDIIEGSTSSQLIALGSPESGLATTGKYLWNRGTDSSTDFVVEIDETTPEPGRQRSTYRALSCTHETNEEDSRHTQQCYHLAHPVRRAKPKHFSFFCPSFSAIRCPLERNSRKARAEK